MQRHVHATQAPNHFAGSLAMRLTATDGRAPNMVAARPVRSADLNGVPHSGTVPAGGADIGTSWSTIGTRAYAVFAFVALSSAFYFLFTGAADPRSAVQNTAISNPAYILMWLTLIAITGLMLARRVMIEGLPRGIGLLAVFAFYLFASTIWSATPGRTLLYGTMLIANFAVGATLALYVPPRRMLTILAWTTMALCLTSLGLLLVAKGVVSSPRYGGAWLTPVELHGVFGHKSDAGYYFALASLLIGHAPGMRLGLAMRGLLVGVTLFAILLANSATALVAVIVLHVLLVLSQLPRIGNVLLVSFAAFAVLVAVALPFIDIGTLVGVVGREPSLTGRVPIWKMAMTFIAERPVFGHGYYAFFDLDPFSPVWELWKIDPWFRTPHFHNSSLDVIVHLGFVGWLFYMAMLAMALAVAANPTIEPRTRQLLLAALTLFVVSTGFDFTFMKHITFSTTLLSYCFFAAQRDYRAG